MKKMNFLIAACFLLMLGNSCASQKQSGNESAATGNLLEDQAYTFVAQTVFPTEDARYNVRNLFPNSTSLYQLTSRYDLRITPDSVVAFLPFYGRSYTAPVDPTKGGIKFTSTKFDYKKSRRKGSYEITITPRDYNEVTALYLSISPNGYASLRVNSLNKTPIAFNGIIEKNN